MTPFRLMNVTSTRFRTGSPFWPGRHTVLGQSELVIGQALRKQDTAITALRRVSLEETTDGYPSLRLHATMAARCTLIGPFLRAHNIELSSRPASACNRGWWLAEVAPERAALRRTTQTIC